MTLSLARVNRGWFVLIVSGILGLGLGATACAEWQVAVESAQAISGVVAYPAQTPAYLYHRSVWTILRQLLAILLKLGASEAVLSVSVSGILGMISLQALSMFVFALGADALVAILTALVVFFSRLTDVGGPYPIHLMGTPFSEGSLGLSLVVLIIGLVGAGWLRSGAFLLGLMPAVHAPLGIWILLLTGACAAWDASLRTGLQSAWRYFLGGAAAAIASLAVHLSSAPAGLGWDAMAAATYLPAFVSAWDHSANRPRC
jgi:hypothetical protein